MSEVKEKTKKRIGILRGGAGKRYHASLKKGGDIILFIHENLADKYKPLDILVDRDYIWHCDGIPVNPGDLMNRVDLVWNTAHHSLSNILESLSIPTIGPGVFFGSLINNRDALREHVKSLGVHMPRYIVSPQNAREVFEKFGSPWIVKKGNEVRVAHIFNELAEMIDGVSDVVVEEFIAGTPSAVHSVAGLRGESVYVMSPENFTIPEKEKVINLAKTSHRHLGAQHYMKFDFTLHPKRGVFLTSLDFTPDLRAGSHFDQSCQSIGTKMHQVVEHILEGAL